MEFSGPPPLFKQGATARAKVAVFSTLALMLLFVDSHLSALSVLRQSVGTMLYLMQEISMAPRDAAYKIGDYLSSVARCENRRVGNECLNNCRSWVWPDSKK